MDRVNNGGLDSANDCLNNDYNDSDDPVCDLVEKLKKIRNNCFVQASDNILKAQKHQAKKGVDIVALLDQYLVIFGFLMSPITMT